MSHPFKGKSQSDKGRARYRAEGGVVERWSGMAANRTPYKSDSEAQAEITVTDRAGNALRDLAKKPESKPSWDVLATPEGWKTHNERMKRMEGSGASSDKEASSARAKPRRAASKPATDAGRYRPDLSSGHKRGGRT